MAYFPSASPEGSSNIPIKRVRIWYALLITILAIFFIRLFYLQVIRYDHYKTAALSDQLKQYEIPATRGTIS
jgi:cell division protein FtsI/penicillin-binding protein 2